MKRSVDRKAYLDLIGLTNGRGLCNACRFAEWSGSVCSEMDLICKHPLPAINGSGLNEDHPYDVWGEGADCWGFRPAQTLQEVGEWVGIILEGNMPDRDKKGRLVAIVPSENDRIEGLVL